MFGSFFNIVKRATDIARNTILPRDNQNVINFFKNIVRQAMTIRSNLHPKGCFIRIGVKRLRTFFGPGYF